MRDVLAAQPASDDEAFGTRLDQEVAYEALWKGGHAIAPLPEAGFGGKFTAALFQIGIEDSSDLAGLEKDAVDDVKEALSSSGGASGPQVAKVVAAIETIIR